MAETNNEEEIRVELSHSALHLQEIVDWTSAADCGAIVSFIGTTRDNFEGKKVIHLEYEAYEPMAKKQMFALGQQAKQKWPEVRKIALSHRLGVVPVTESSVIIVASSPHRTEALECVHWAIDQLKAVVPIWKNEVYQDGDRIWKENKECKHAQKSHSSNDTDHHSHHHHH